MIDKLLAINRLSLVAVTCLFCLSQGEITVNQVLETTNISEFNQWVSENRLEYPGLKPVLIDCAHDLEKLSVKQYEITYYQKNGNILATEVINSDSFTAHVPLTNDRLLIYKYKPGKESEISQTIVKDAKGKTIFAVPYCVIYLGMDIYVESRSRYAEPDVKILNRTGKQVGVLKDVTWIDLSRLCIADDERYAVFNGIRGETYDQIILINREGKEMWRRPGHCYSLFMSKDGSKIGMHHGKTVSVFLEDGSFLSAYNPFDVDHGFDNSFSEDGNWYLAGDYSKVEYYDNTTGELLWENDTLLAKHGDRVRYLGVIGNGELIVVLCFSHNIYVFGKEGNLLKKTNLDLGEEWHYTIDRQKDSIIKTLGSAKKWFVEFVDDLVIVTKGKSYAFERRSDPLTKFVYKITGN
jgi:hypothetical protein